MEEKEGEREGDRGGVEEGETPSQAALDAGRDPLGGINALTNKGKWSIYGDRGFQVNFTTLVPSHTSTLIRSTVANMSLP